MLKEKMSRYKKSIMSVCLGLLTLFVGVCSFSFDSKASVVDEYYLDYAEPACSATQGYVSLALQSDRTGEIDIFTFFWNSVALDDNVEQPCMMYIDIVGNGVIYFSPYVNLAYVDSAIYTLTRINPDGVFVPYYPSTGASTKVSWNFSMDGYTFVGMKYGGNVIGDYAQEQYYSFALYFSTDGSAQQLMYIYGLLQSSNDLSNSQNTKLTNIYNQQVSTNQKLEDVKSYLQTIREDLSDIEDKLDEILEEDKKQTSWLQKIWEALTGSDSEKEKIEEEKGKAEEQASQLEGLNEQNKTEKVDPSQAQDSVNGAIDNNQIQNYSVVLSVFTHDSHIGQMMLIVIALTLVSYVLFGKK